MSSSSVLEDLFRVCFLACVNWPGPNGLRPSVFPFPTEIEGIIGKTHVGVNAVSLTSFFPHIKQLGRTFWMRPNQRP